MTSSSSSNPALKSKVLSRMKSLENDESVSFEQEGSVVFLGNQDVECEKTLANRLGEGKFGTTFGGNLLNGEKVAIKFLKQSNATIGKALSLEANILALLQHENIIGMKGIQVNNPPYFIIFEKAVCSLYEALYTRELTHSLRISKDNYTRKTQVLLQCSAALVYLHSTTVVHGNIQCATVLLSQEGNVKLSDFGFMKSRSLVIEKTIGSLKSVFGSVRALQNAAAPQYLAPEILNDTKSKDLPFTEKSDVYALGILMNEVLDHAPPFPGLTAQNIVNRLKRADNNRPALFARDQEFEENREQMTALQILIKQCWNDDAQHRPTIDEVERELQKIYSAVQNHNYSADEEKLMDKSEDVLVEKQSFLEFQSSYLNNAKYVGSNNSATPKIGAATPVASAPTRVGKLNNNASTSKMPPMIATKSLFNGVLINKDNNVSTPTNSDHGSQVSGSSIVKHVGTLSPMMLNLKTPEGGEIGAGLSSPLSDTASPAGTTVIISPNNNLSLLESHANERKSIAVALFPPPIYIPMQSADSESAAIAEYNNIVIDVDNKLANTISNDDVRTPASAASSVWDKGSQFSMNESRYGTTNSNTAISTYYLERKQITEPITEDTATTEASFESNAFPAANESYGLGRNVGHFKKNEGVEESKTGVLREEGDKLLTRLSKGSSLTVPLSPVNVPYRSSYTTAAEEIESLYYQASNCGVRASCAELIKLSAVNPLAEAFYMAMICYGSGIEKDYKKAIEIAKHSFPWLLNQSDKIEDEGMNSNSSLKMYSQYLTGICYEQGIGTARDLPEAVKYYQMSADQGYAGAQSNLGFCFKHGLGVNESDIHEAIRLYRLGSEQGHATAQNNLGYCYQHGDGVPADLQEAVKYFKLSADQGYSAALYNLAHCYTNGVGIDMNIEEAARLYQLGAIQGCAFAQNTLGHCYKRGLGVGKDFEQATKYYFLSAKQGHATAQNNLGYCYQYGQGVPKDLAEAVKWYKLSAEQGHATAQNNLGYCFQHGYGVAKDYDQAAKFYELSANQGYATGIFNLGKCFQKGYGKKKDKQEAMRLYGVAAEKGEQSAINELKKPNFLSLFSMK